MTTQLATIPQQQTIEDTLTLGKLLASSGYFADSRDAAQAVVKVLAGRELGFGPIASMAGVNIIKGKVSLSANLIAAAIKRSGRYNYRVREMSDDVCSIEFFENGQSVGVSSFSMDNAKAAGLATGDNWRKFPRNMLFARAISNGAKCYFKDLSWCEIYTPDELGAQIDGETGEVIDAPAPRVVVEQPTPQPAANGNGAPPSDLPGFEVWADWSRPDHAIAWGMAQGVFDHQRHAENAYAKVKAANNPANAREMWAAWYVDVQRRVAERDALAASTAPDPNPDWQDIIDHGVELPHN